MIPLLTDCEDAYEVPGEWEAYVDGDLSDGMELLATGTDWRELPPEAFAEALHGLPPEEQDELLSAAFGSIGGPYTTFAVFFPEGVDDPWYERTDTDGSELQNVLIRSLRGFGLLILRTEEGTTRHYIGRQPGYLARCEVDGRPCCGGVVPSYRLVDGRCEVTNG